MDQEPPDRTTPPPAPGPAPVSAALLTPVMRVVLGVLGGGSFGAGVVAVFVTQNGTGTGVLLAVGAVLLVIALLGNLVESFEVGGTSLRLRAAAAERYALADASDRAGDHAGADALREEARSLLGAAGPIAADYVSVRGSMRSGAARTRAMGRVVDRARRLASEDAFDAAEVRGWLSGADDGERITALAMMQARPELRDLEAVLGAVAHPRSPFEQFHALKLCSAMLDDLDDAQVDRLVEVIEGASMRQGSVLNRGIDRVLLAAGILDRAHARAESPRTPRTPGAPASAPHAPDAPDAPEPGDYPPGRPGRPGRPGPGGR